MQINIGAPVFVKHATRVWDAGRIVSGSESDSYTVSVGAGGLLKKLTVQADDIVRACESHISPSAVSASEFKSPVSEGAVLDLVRRRAASGKDFSGVGDMLVSVNSGTKTVNWAHDLPLPYLSLPANIDDTSELFCRPGDSKLQPHVFKIANRALRQLLRGIAHDPSTSQVQSVLVYGESGSGKSVVSKHLLRFLLAADAKISEGNGVSSAGGEGKCLPSTKSLEFADHILQSFGCCTMPTGKNSSRYVGNIECSYSAETNSIVKVSFEPLLLEKSRLRVGGVGSGQRSFNVFYQLLAGADSSIKESLFIPPEDMAAFPFLSAGGLGIDVTTDSSGFFSLRDSIGPKGIGCSPEEIDAVWKVLGAVLHLSTVNSFFEDGQVTFASTTTANVAALLGLTESAFVEFIKSPHKKDHDKYPAGLFKARCESIASALFEGAFFFLLGKLSSVMPGGPVVSAPTSEHSLRILEVSSTIAGTSDGSGSLDQLLLNAVNESVQQRYFAGIFSETEYEGSSRCKNNSQVHSLLFSNEEDGRGILEVLDSCSSKTVGDETFLLKGGLDKERFVSSHPCYERKEESPPLFRVEHNRAGSNSGLWVQYDVRGMLGANNLVLFRGSTSGVNALMELESSSSDIKVIMQAQLKSSTSGTGVAKLISLCDDVLAPIFTADSPLIVHCMRMPAGDTGHAYLLEQLTRGGSDLVNVAASRAAGFPLEISKEEFLVKFRSIPGSGGNVDDTFGSVGVISGGVHYIVTSDDKVRIKDDGTIDNLIRAVHPLHHGGGFGAEYATTDGRRGVVDAKILALKAVENLTKTPNVPRVVKGPRTPQDISAEKIQRLVRRFTSNSRVQTLHKAIEDGDIAKVKFLLTAHPEDVRTINKAQEYCSVHHSALKSGSLEMLQTIGLRPVDVISKDAGDHTTAHYAVLNKPTISTFQLLNKCLSQVHIPDPEGKAAAAENLHAKKSAAGLGSGKTQGWLLKYSKGQWLKRWFVVDDRGLSYFHEPTRTDYKPNDTYPLTKQDSLYSRSYFVKNTIIVNTSQRSYAKKRKVLVIKAESEAETQSWLLALSRVCYIEPFREGFLRYRNSELCTEWLREVTWADETALHTLARAKFHGAMGNTQVAAASWLIDHGCPVNDLNYEGKTALHIAISNHNQTLAFGLFKKGASLSIKDAAGKLPLDYAPHVLHELFQSHGTTTVKHLKLRSPLLDPPLKSFGYSYVTLFFMTQTLGTQSKTGKTMATKHPVLTVSLHRPDSELVEPPQDICTTVYSDAHHIYWGHSIHLQVSVLIFFSPRPHDRRKSNLYFSPRPLWST